MASALGIVKNQDRIQLKEYGGPSDISDSGTKFILKRMGFVKCKGTKFAKTLPSNFENIKDDFLGRVQTVVEKHKIAPSMIVNFGLPIIPVKDWTMEQQGAKQVQIHGANNKRQITAVLGMSATGTFLPPQLIYQRKTDSRHSSFKFTKDWNITHSKNHWTTVHTTVIYIENILGLYFEDQREKLNLPLAQKDLVLLDIFKVHQTETVKPVLKSQGLEFFFYILASYTSELQHLYISGNHFHKQQLKQKFTSWYADEVTSQLNSGKSVHNVNVDLKLSIVKPLHVKWVLSSFDCSSKQKNILLQGWNDTGILNFVQNKKDDFIECRNSN
ncbi:Hypothetical predicted protein [Octopus vulgaris]|uniref:DDE-1 domain-containing protein n=1 Tax=Octopus vulgaris TaxID=6645 RepID=A0AA36AJS7_OCTVU|nr:Hypothetical predicted protein [Octopus vulgaris]